MNIQPDHQRDNSTTNAGRRKLPTSPGEGGSKFGWDEVIVIFFALLGFVGSVYLYRTGSPSIMVSVFLATGVASLVYRFLGGIQDATFVWGALKLGGTAAALLGIAIGVDHYLSAELLVTVPSEGRYEWQWAGEGWIGYIDVEKNGSAQIEMGRYITCGNAQKKLPLLQQSGAAKVEGIEGLTKLRVSIPVKFVNYDASCDRIDLGETTILEGVLVRTPAFTGQIQYRRKDGAGLGDMILIKGVTSGVH